jgi:acyl carrier protein
MSTERTAFLRRLEPIFRDVLDPGLTLTEDLDASRVPQWDSLNHISLVVAIEGDFGIELTVDELATMRNVGDLVDILVRKGCKA